MEDNNQEYIRNYWFGKFTETERQVFEQKCVDDEGFANSVAQFMQLNQIATNNEKDRLKTLYKNNKKSNRNQILVLIIGLLLVLTIVFRMFFSSSDTIENVKPVNEEMIFAMLVEEHQDASRGDDASSDEVYRKWFETEKYDSLLFELEAVNILNPVHVNELIWASQSLYKQNKNTEVISLINNYMSSNVDNISRKDELLWLQTLAYLKNNDNGKAKSNLEKILNEYRLYQKEAKQLLDSLK